MRKRIGKAHRVSENVTPPSVNGSTQSLPRRMATSRRMGAESTFAASPVERDPISALGARVVRHPPDPTHLR